MLFFEFAAIVVRALMVLLYRAKAFGAEKVPQAGPVLLVANHQSYLDPPLVGVTVRPGEVFEVREACARSADARGRILMQLLSRTSSGI